MTTETEQNLFDLERSVLGSMLLLGDSDVPEWVERIDARMFLEPKCRQIAFAVDELIGNRQPIDPVTVVDKLRGWGVSLAATVAEVESEAATTANLNYQARRLVEKYRMRRLRAVVANLSKEMDNLRMDEIRDEIEKLGQIAQPLTAQNDLVTLKEATKDFLRSMDHGSANVLLQTGISAVDDELILNAGELTILGARPSMGKTALAALVARHATRQQERGSVVMFSLEMRSVEIMKRLLAAESGFEIKNLGQAFTDGNLADAINEFYKLDFWFDDRPDMSIDAMRANLRALRNRIQLVVVDYLQLVKIDRKRERRDLVIGDIAKGLKLIAKEFNCHVLALSQLSRQVEKRNPPIPENYDLRDSGNLEEDADNVIFLYRPYVYDRTQDPEKAVLKIGKQRHGRRDLEIKIRWIGRLTKFTDW